jgi:hypothetical protein
MERRGPVSRRCDTIASLRIPPQVQAFGQQAVVW